MSTTTIPQHQAARDKANRYRIAAAEFKAEAREYPMAEGCAIVADLLEAEVPEALGHMRLVTVVGSPCWMGKVRALRLLVHAGISPGRTEARLDKLTQGERLRVAGALRAKANE